MRALDAKGNSLRVDALDSSALAIEVLVQVAGTVDLVTQTGANAERHHGSASAAGPVGMVDGTGCTSELRKA